ncbi:pyrimidine dimer DNA glycosylase/endonuclease V [Rothia sp. AR01]|uniref:Pyrimidine dimer DNA glycosylase/endonuclease V n=1 Tax=Rothia santali TaxID=2949643 RepID=A0A9X2HJZ6_9MICC|nr:pyrimidine dimer DNA glycosylase/endonuclease V [Rothia santali]MCP3425683.1 pyrimidine dimer DNA glycosylase/endonuclease V [Rothia santali]
MRLWSLHPDHLDAKGLVAGWREALLAQKVLAGATHGYRNHPQLVRFKAAPDPQAAMSAFLRPIAEEATARGYNFDRGKIIPGPVIAAEADVADPGPELTGLGFVDARHAPAAPPEPSGPAAPARPAPALLAAQTVPQIPVTEGQVRYEAELLLFKLRMRSPKMVDAFEDLLRTGLPRLHPLFNLVPGDVEPWEKVRNDL